MKNIALYILALGMFFTACDPMEDINKELDDKFAQEANKMGYFSQFEVAPEAYTLTDDDYALSSNENVAKYKSFDKYNLPKDNLPEILNQRFAGEDGTEMLVTYDFYSKVVKDEENAHVISEDEYLEMGQKYGNFSDEDAAEYAIGKLFDEQAKYEVIEAGEEKTAMYILYKTNQMRYIKVNDDYTAEVLKYEGDDSYTLVDEDYESVGEGKYKNFFTIGVALEKVPQFAQQSGKGPGNYTCKVYKNYLDTYVVYRHDGMMWNVAQSTVAQTEPLNFKVEDDFTKSYWWADPAIKITLTDADYASDELTSKYKNFDLRAGAPYADPAARAVALGNMVELNHGPVVDNQQYLVTYVYYDGSRGEASDRIVRVVGEWQQYKQPK